MCVFVSLSVHFREKNVLSSHSSETFYDQFHTTRKICGFFPTKKSHLIKAGSTRKISDLRVLGKTYFSEGGPGALMYFNREL